MTPESRGSAAVLAVALSTVAFLGGLWLAFSQGDPELDGRIHALHETRAFDPGGSDGRQEVAEARALYRWISEDRSSAPPLGEFALRREAPEPERLDPAGVTALEGTLRGSCIVLQWSATGGETPSGYRVERLDESGVPLTTTPVGAGERSFTDQPVGSLSGSRTFRVTAVAHDGTVAGADQKKVPFRVAFEVVFLGLDPDGSSRFRIDWPRDGATISEEFAMRAGDEIGGPLPEREGRPALDWSTGWKYVAFRASRTVEIREVEVPVFSEDGKLARDGPEGEPIREVRSVQVPRVVEGAEVLPAGETETRWVAKD